MVDGRHFWDMGPVAIGGELLRNVSYFALDLDLLIHLCSIFSRELSRFKVLETFSLPPLYKKYEII